jgi:hypothetical protein
MFLLNDDDDAYLIEIAICGLQNLSLYQYGTSQNGISTRWNQLARNIYIWEYKVLVS